MNVVKQDLEIHKASFYNILVPWHCSWTICQVDTSAILIFICIFMFLDKHDLDWWFISNFSLAKLVRGTKYFDLKSQI